MKQLYSCLFLMIAQFLCFVAISQTSKPNVVYILMDDLGYGDVKCNNPDGKIPTPNIDQLAADGMRFTDAHSGSSICSPTRYGILTGRYAWRTKMQDKVLGPYSPALISDTTTTVGHLFQQAGYKTGCIGKWHLGVGWRNKFGKEAFEAKDVDLDRVIEDAPIDRGFNYYYGYTAQLGIAPYMFAENNKIIKTELEPIKPDMSIRLHGGFQAPGTSLNECLEIMASKTVEFIDKNKKAPFFLYLPMPAPHEPFMPGKDFQGKSGIDTYSDFVMEADWFVGQVVKALQERGLAENTMIIFTSDNGCAPYEVLSKLKSLGHNPNHIFRGAKSDLFEGGHHIPFVIKWPGHVKKGTVNHTTISLGDFMATAADVLKIKLKTNEAPDSYSFLPALKNKNIERKSVVHHSWFGNFAIRKGDWKLLLCPGSGGWAWPSNEAAVKEGLPKYQLYNLKDDPSEKNNLQAQHPELVQELEALLMQIVENGRSTKGEKLKNDVEVKVWK